MGTKAHDRMFQAETFTPADDIDLSELIDDSIDAWECLREITPRGMAALLSVEI